MSNFIELSLADNGIIKKIHEDNIDGTDRTLKLTYVYKNESVEDSVEILYDISQDLGLQMGNKFDDKCINITIGEGSKFTPSDDEIDDKIKELKEKIEELESLKSKS